MFFACRNGVVCNVENREMIALIVDWIVMIRVKNFFRMFHISLCKCAFKCIQMQFLNSNFRPKK